MLSSERDCQVLSELCPLFKGRIKEDPIKGSSFQVQLNVFEYYMFWFSYYPVCRGNSENSANISAQKSKRLRNWASSIPGFSSNRRGSVQKIDCNLYIRLLYAYLREFVPIYDLSAHQPYRSSLLHYSAGNDDSIIMQAEFFVNTLIHFWLLDNDFSPVSVKVCKSFGVSFPFRSVLGETPPTSGLGEVVKLFVKYLNLSSVVLTEGSVQVEYGGNPRWAVSGFSDVVKSRDVMPVSPCVRSVASWNLMIQRPLYRFILRTFLFCPVESSIKNVSEVFSLWIGYMEPWRISLDDFRELDAIVNGSKNARKEDEQLLACGYSSAWQDYVLSNYLFYSSLVMHFLGFAHKFLHSDAEVIVQMALKVINTLTSSRELITLIRNVYTVYHSKQAGPSKSHFNTLYRFVPSIREQLQDWEDGLCETDADGSFLHENWNKDLQLFSDTEDGGQQLLQLFILRAESELQSMSGENLSNSIQCLNSLKEQVESMFGGHILKPFSLTPEPKQNHHQSRDEIFKPRRIGNHAVGNFKYKGDWMKRPISDDEVAWLARLLVWISDWLNESLGLNETGASGQVSPAWSYVEVSDAVSDVEGTKESVKMVLYSLGSWLLMLGPAVVGLMRKYGVRVNLRVLASKRVVLVLVMCVVFSLLKKLFWGV